MEKKKVSNIIRLLFIHLMWFYLMIFASKVFLIFNILNFGGVFSQILFILCEKNMDDIGSRCSLKIYKVKKKLFIIYSHKRGQRKS
jgi:hypothetical protein